MADKTLTSLTAAASFAASDLLYGKVGSDSRKISGTVLTAFLATATLSAGTLTVSAPFTLTQTWNDAGVTFTGALFNFINTASAAGSLLLNLQLNSSPLFSFTKEGILRFGVAGSTGIRGAATANLEVQSQNNGDYRGINLSQIGFSNQTFVQSDAANTLAQRNGTASQTANLYDTWASSTDYHRVARKTARATLSGVSGASVTATGLIPAGAKLIGITTKVTTGLGTGNGTTGYAVGTAADPNLWGDVVGTAAGTSSAGVDATADPAGVWSASARDVILTAAGGNFDGTGVIYVAAFYEIVQAD